jgi:hypothetical protein
MTDKQDNRSTERLQGAAIDWTETLGGGGHKHSWRTGRRHSAVTARSGGVNCCYSPHGDQQWESTEEDSGNSARYWGPAHLRTKPTRATTPSTGTEAQPCSDLRRGNDDEDRPEQNLKAKDN